MSLFSIFMIGIGLSMDAFAVSIARGMTMKKEDLLRYALTLGFFFGVFQAVMPLIGWWAGSYFQEFIASIDHCIWSAGHHRREHDTGVSSWRGGGL